MSDNVSVWKRISLSAIKDYWLKMGLYGAPLAWEYPPTLGQDYAPELTILTANYNLYVLKSYHEFYRLMIRDGDVKLVHKDGTEEVVIEAYVPRPTVLPKTKGSFLTMLLGGPDADVPNNLLKFKPKKK